MALHSVTRKAVESALREFDLHGREAMLEKYGGGASTCWYIHHNGLLYDQKLILRVAHDLSGLGSLPPGRGTFTASQAREFLNRLGFEVVRHRMPAPISRRVITETSTKRRKAIQALANL